MLYADRVKETTATTGTGSVVTNGAVTGYQSFATAGFTTGQTVDYLIEDGSNWEVGNKAAVTVTNGIATVARNPYASSSKGAAISLSGKAVVSVTITANRFSPLAPLTESPPQLSAMMSDWLQSLPTTGGAAGWWNNNGVPTLSAGGSSLVFSSASNSAFAAII